MKKVMQTGSAHVVIIIGLVVALICALGIAFYQNIVLKNQADTNSVSSSNVSNKTAEKSESTSVANRDKSSVAKDDAEYLKIGEWNVKFPMSFNDTLSYKLNSSNEAAIGVKSLTDGDASAQCQTSSGGMIIRGMGSDHWVSGAGDPSAFPTFAEAYAQKTEGIGRAGEYYYAYLPNHGASCEGDQELIQNKIKAMVAKVQSL